MDSPGLEQIGALSALDDPVRRRLYEYVAGSDEPVGRDAAAGAAGVTRSLAAYHLDRLAAEGLLTVAYERPLGPQRTRRRPAGQALRPLRARVQRRRPAARLRPRRAPARRGGGERPQRRHRRRPAGRGRPARTRGRGDGGDLAELLAARGYEPYADGEGVLRLRNCPFHAAAQRHPDVVCDMNLALAARAARRSRHERRRSRARARAGTLLRRAQAALGRRSSWPAYGPRPVRFATPQRAPSWIASRIGSPAARPVVMPAAKESPAP